MHTSALGTPVLSRARSAILELGDRATGDGCSPAGDRRNDAVLLAPPGQPYTATSSPDGSRNIDFMVAIDRPSVRSKDLFGRFRRCRGCPRRGRQPPTFHDVVVQDVDASSTNSSEPGHFDSADVDPASLLLVTSACASEDERPDGPSSRRSDPRSRARTRGRGRRAGPWPPRARRGSPWHVRCRSSHRASASAPTTMATLPWSLTPIVSLRSQAHSNPPGGDRGRALLRGGRARPPP